MFNKDLIRIDVFFSCDFELGLECGRFVFIYRDES